MWYEKLGFEDDPYGIKRPRFIPLQRLTWNRDDLKDKWQLDRFIEDTAAGNSVSLRVFGPTRSGKTWLLRIIEKDLQLKLKDALVLYIQIPEAEPTLHRFYEEFIESLTPYLEKVLEGVKKKAGTSIEKWIKILEDEDFARSLYHIYCKDDHSYVSQQWLRGVGISSSALRETGIISPLSGSKKMDLIIRLIVISLNVFPSCVLCVDEIGLVRPPSLARVIGSALKGLLDTLYERFGLVCTYTAELSDTILDRGYSEHFYKRFNYEVKMDPIRKDYLPDFLKLHHKCYRRKNFEISDELYPFTKDGIFTLFDALRAENRYPGPLLHSCAMIAHQAVSEGIEKIDEKFVKNNIGRIPKDYLP